MMELLSVRHFNTASLRFRGELVELEDVDVYACGCATGFRAKAAVLIACNRTCPLGVPHAFRQIALEREGAVFHDHGEERRTSS